MSDAGSTLELGGDVLKVVRELGLFRAEDVAELTGLDEGEIERSLRDNPQLVEPVPDRNGMWRVLVGPPAATPDRPAADPKVAEGLADAAVAAIRTVGRGLVQEPEVRNITLGVAEQRVQLAQSAAARRRPSCRHGSPGPSAPSPSAPAERRGTGPAADQARRLDGPAADAR